MTTAHVVLRVVVGLGLGAVAFAGSALGAIVLGPPPDFSETSLPSVRATPDPATVAEGEYLFHAVAHCADCHAPGEKSGLVDRPLPTGGQGIRTPFGSFYPSNLTSHPGAGVGAVTDGELARVIRHGVAPGAELSPFMSIVVGGIDDRDLTALVSYIRTLPPSDNAVPPSQPNLVGRVLLAAGVFAPADKPVPPWAPRSETPDIARGRYLAEGPANCIGCHTHADPLDGGAFQNPPFSGGGPHVVTGEEELELIPPNLTPDPTHGAMRGWTEEDFVWRFTRVGRTIPDTIMPWEAYGQMAESDLRSLWRYLTSLEPVRHDPGPVVRRRW